MKTSIRRWIIFPGFGFSDSKPFVSLKPGLFSASEDDILVRCVTTKFVKKQNVNLKINGKMFKDAHKYYRQTWVRLRFSFYYPQVL